MYRPETQRYIRDQGLTKVICNILISNKCVRVNVEEVTICRNVPPITFTRTYYNNDSKVQMLKGQFQIFRVKTQKLTTTRAVLTRLKKNVNFVNMPQDSRQEFSLTTFKFTANILTDSQKGNVKIAVWEVEAANRVRIRSGEKMDSFNFI